MNFRGAPRCVSLWSTLVVTSLLAAILCAAVHAQPSPGRQQQMQLQEELRLRTEKLRELLGRPIASLAATGGGSHRGGVGVPASGVQKRPFCNAFTGCAGKRAPFALPSGDKQRLRFFRKFDTIDNSDSDEYVADNTNYDREVLQD